MTTPTPEMIEAWNEWLSDSPDSIKELGQKMQPWKLYRLKTTGQHCQVASFFEDGTVSVDIVGHDDPTIAMMNELVPLNVFGIKPSDLEEIEASA